MPEREAVRVEVQTVVGRISAPILHSGPAFDDEPDPSLPAELTVVGAPAADLPWSTLRRPSIPVVSLAVPLLAGSAVALLMGDPGLGAGCGLVLWLAGTVGSISRRMRFSFGDGFVGYRPDPAWPQGVQEEDDVRWDWRVRREPSDDLYDTAAQT